jgi:RHS repeat-associated protein
MYGRYTDQVFAEADADGNHWLLTDQVATVRDVVGAAGVSETHYVYDTFGRKLSGGLTDNLARLTFNGLEFTSIDGSGHYRARTYMPDIGRFAQMDPKFPFGYSFVGNSPLTFSDPSGKTALIEYACFAVGAVASACTIYSWLSPIGDIFKAVGEFLSDLNSNPPDSQALVQAFLNSTYYFLVGGLPFSNGPMMLIPSCGQSLLISAGASGFNAAIGNPTPFPCQGALY